MALPLRFLKPVAGLLLVATTTACFHELPPVPTKGYGDPYKPTGKPIYVHDARGGWEVAEGGKPITSEQALEATKDPEYEIRRQEAKKYNQQIFEEGESHRTRGKIMLGSGTVIAIGGFVVMALLPTALRGTTDTPATATSPEVKELKPGGASNAALLGGLGVGILGIAIAAYGYIGGNVDPPYHIWKTPKDLDRPAYVREKTEKYNEDIGAPPVEDQPGAVETLPLAPGQRKPPPSRPTTGGGRGGATNAGPPPPGVAPATPAPPPTGRQPYPRGGAR